MVRLYRVAQPLLRQPAEAGLLQPNGDALQEQEGHVMLQAKLEHVARRALLLPPRHQLLHQRALQLAVIAD